MRGSENGGNHLAGGEARRGKGRKKERKKENCECELKSCGGFFLFSFLVQFKDTYAQHKHFFSLKCEELSNMALATRTRLVF
jgi:hypothetical protein